MSRLRWGRGEWVWLRCKITQQRVLCEENIARSVYRAPAAPPRLHSMRRFH